MKKRLLIILALMLSVMTCSNVFADENSDNPINQRYKLKVLRKIDSPKDVKKLDAIGLEQLADDIRYAIIKRANTYGGHLGPDLAVVEATIALHYVFNSPKDKIVFDVSHQCYPHKIITGRKDGFLKSSMFSKISGYTNPDESEHDFFKVGHTSTGISLATGLAKGRDLKHEQGNIIAFVGDGSLSGGEAYEGLNNAAVLGSNFIIIVNDNEMAIAENHGGLYKNLAELRATNGQAPNNIFKALGFDYYYVENGNNVYELINTFKQIKDIDHPTVVHIHTLKGKGLKAAEENKEKYHYIGAGALNKKTADLNTMDLETYNSITADYVLNKKKNDSTFTVISPATPAAIGLTKEIREQLGEQYTDVGIAEEHAVAYASGIAKAGGTPVLGVMSSFVQRTYDQLSQDLAINNSPATILVFGGGIYGADVTHLGIFDISMISNIPNIVYLAPTTKEEYIGMLDWATSQRQHPVAIRVPAGKVIATGVADKTDYSKINKYKVTEQGSEIAIIAAGDFYQLGKQLKQEIAKKLNINATLINPVYLTGIDAEVLSSLKTNHTLVITLESGLINGGFGEKISRYFADSYVKVVNYGATKEFTDRLTTKELYKKYHLTPDLIVKDILKYYR